ncbi:MAG: hypothetical protein R2831_02025 [Chitinophagaceae bacterium]
MKKIILLSFLFLVFTSYVSYAQHSIGPNMPSWVAMIDNPNTNFYEAIATFNAYWKDKIEPEEEADQNEENKMDEEKQELLKKQLATMSPAERNEYDQIQYHYKRFKKWIFESRPYVQDDGRILTQEERINIWTKQQLEMKKQQK